MSFEHVLKTLLERSDISVPDFIRWFESYPGDADQGAFPKAVADLYDADSLEALKPEMALSLLNLIRDQSVKILTDGQSLNQTPSKANHPGKYDYESPVKTVMKASLSTGAANDGRPESKAADVSPRRKVQLFKAEGGSSPGGDLDDLGAMKPLEEDVDIDDDALMRAVKQGRPMVVTSSSPDTSSANQPAPPEATLKLNSGINNKKTTRRSLDSCLSGGSSVSGSGTGLKKGQSAKKAGKSPQLAATREINLADFIVDNRGKKKNKKGKRRSDGNFGASNEEDATVAPTLPLDEKTQPKKVPLQTSKIPPSQPGNIEDQELNLVSKQNTPPNAGSRPKEVCLTTRPKDVVAMTPEKKAQFANANVWDRIAKSMDKSSKKLRDEENDGGGDEAAAFSKTKRGNSSLVEPTPLLVTYQNQLDKLVHLYTYCLKNNYVPNILVELYLLLELLTVKNEQSAYAATGSANSSGYLGSVHNCVYFATHVLNSQAESLLCGPDRVTLRYLLENPRLEVFVPGLRTRISDVLAANERYLKKTGSYKPAAAAATAKQNDLQSVRFQCDTDNRDNFPDCQTFQDFRRQRDMFYDILRGWKHYLQHGSKPAHTKAATSGGGGGGRKQQAVGGGKSGGSKQQHHRFTFALEELYGAEINSLITLQMNPVNMAHFADLFQNQMLSMCLSELTNLSVDNSDDDLTKELGMPAGKVDAGKLKRLMNRCITPSNYGGPCPKPNFSGMQEFFRDFLRIAGGNHVFLAHLKNSLATSITDLNDKVFEVKKSGDLGNPFEEPNDENFYVAILSLRVLAKFLGYVEALPYFYSQATISGEKLLNAQINLRKKYAPCLDIYRMLKESASRRRLILTLPWTVEYCSVQDPITMQLPYFKKVFALMVKVYKRQLSHQNQTKHSDSPRETAAASSGGKKRVLLQTEKVGKINRFNAYFLCVHLGWLFENQNFPRELFISPVMASAAAAAIGSRERNESGGGGGFDGVVDARNGDGIDYAINLRPGILYTCCPYMSELKVVMSQFHTGFKAPKTAVTTSGSGGAKTTAANVAAQTTRPSSVVATAAAAAKKQHQRRGSYFDAESSTNTQDSDEDEAASGAIATTRPKGQTTRDFQKRAEASYVQANLEENFFFNQKSSVKQSIEFVTERLTNNLIKKVSQRIVASELRSVQAHLRDTVALMMQGASPEEQKMCQNEIECQTKVMARNAYYMSRKASWVLLCDTAFVTCNAALRPILPVDTRHDVVETCVAIATAIIVAKVKDWVSKNLTKAFFRQELNKFVEETMKAKSSVTATMLGRVDGLHLAANPTVDPPRPSWVLLSEAKTLASQVLAGEVAEAKVVEQRSRSLIADVQACMASDVLTLAEENAYRVARNPIPPYVQSPSDVIGTNAAMTSETDVTIRGFEMVTVELAVAICAGCPKALTSDLQDAMVSLWGGSAAGVNRSEGGSGPLTTQEGVQGFPVPPQQLFSIMSSRNIRLLAASKSPLDSWNKMEYLLGRLLRHGVILPIVLEDECLQFLKQTWPPEVLQRFGSCIKGVVDTYKRELATTCGGGGGVSQDFNQEFLEWIAWFVAEAAADELEDNLDNFPELM